MKILAVLHFELFADILTSLFEGVVATLSISKALSEWGSSAILTWFLIARYDTSVEKYIELAINVGSTKFCKRSVNLESNFWNHQFFHKKTREKITLRAVSSLSFVFWKNRWFPKLLSRFTYLYPKSAALLTDILLKKSVVALMKTWYLSTDKIIPEFLNNFCLKSRDFIH